MTRRMPEITEVRGRRRSARACAERLSGRAGPNGPSLEAPWNCSYRIGYARHVGTSGAGVAPGEPGFTRTAPSSVAMQNSRTPLLLKFCGAELATKVVFVVAPAAAKPAAKNRYPFLVPPVITLSRMQALA